LLLVPTGESEHLPEPSTVDIPIFEEEEDALSPERSSHGDSLEDLQYGFDREYLERCPPLNFDPASYVKLENINVETDPGITLSEMVVSIDQFTKIWDIRRGSYGDVFVSEDSRSGGLVAVKVFRGDLAVDEIQMFDRQVAILGSVGHKTLVALRGYSPSDSPSEEKPRIIVTEFMPNGSLRVAIAKEFRGSPIPGWDGTRKHIVIYGVAVGMMILHSLRVIHRDLHPRHILLDDQLEPKVRGFDLSKFVDIGGTMQQTMHGGTPAFMAPRFSRAKSMISLSMSSRLVSWSP
jgi:serine/threonine protein kinase